MLERTRRKRKKERWEADLGGGKVPFLGMVTLSATFSGFQNMGCSI
jgi:hypothetical protein